MEPEVNTLLPVELKEERHASLYYDDGNIELSAITKDGGTTQLYKVYRGMLSRSSDVFRDMFAVAGDRQEVVQMPDAAEDLSELLECIFTRKLALKL